MCYFRVGKLEFFVLFISRAATKCFFLSSKNVYTMAISCKLLLLPGPKITASAHKS